MHEAKQRKYFKKQIARIMQTQFNALQVRKKDSYVKSEFRELKSSGLN